MKNSTHAFSGIRQVLSGIALATARQQHEKLMKIGASYAPSGWSN